MHRSAESSKVQRCRSRSSARSVRSTFISETIGCASLSQARGQESFDAAVVVGARLMARIERGRQSSDCVLFCNLR